jgi:transposase-like protein
MPTWETLDTFMRTKIHGTLQELLEEEAAAFLGRAPSVPRAAVDGASGYRNGYGEHRL